MTFTGGGEIHTAATLRRENSCIAVYYGTTEEAGESHMQATQGRIISAQAVFW
jgi:hypothetical protein